MENKKDLRVVRKQERLEFFYKDVFYVYVISFDFPSDSKFLFIIRDGDKIYRSHPYHCTDEGKEVFEAIQTELHLKGGKF